MLVLNLVAVHFESLHGVSFENIEQRTLEDSLCVAVKVFVGVF